MTPFVRSMCWFPPVLRILSDYTDVGNDAFTETSPTQGASESNLEIYMSSYDL